MTSRARAERLALCDTLDRVGPAAPTLCDPWTTTQLAAHLAVRDRRPDAAAGAVVGALAGHTRALQEQCARRPWPELVDLVRSGPPRWSPLRVPALDDAVNLVEFFVHHEDVRRATGPITPRHLDPELSAALWRSVRRMAPLTYGRAPTGVVLVAEGHGRVAARRPPGGAGTVVLRGRPEELLLHAFGRARAAEVVADGSPADVAALAAARRGT